MDGPLPFTILMMYLYSTIPDINECATLNGNCSQTCTNTNGSYYCSCYLGYILGGNNMTCNGELNLIQISQLMVFATDINECSTNNGYCSQTCTNTNGSFYCLCSPGYILGGNNMTCNGELNFDNGDMFD